jgi:hypothetical protein
MVGLSIFVFTDMIPVLALFVAYISLQKKRLFIFLLASIIAILSRQYCVFFLGGTLLYHTIHYYFQRDVYHLKVLFAGCLSLFPLVLFMILWQGASPVNKVNVLYLDQAFQFHIAYLNLYVLQIFVYLFPFVLWHRRLFYQNYKGIIVCFLLSLTYFFFPVEPSVAAVNAGIETVGYFHKFVNFLGLREYAHWIFYFFYFVSLPVLFSVVMGLVSDLRNKSVTAKSYLVIVILMFYLVMPLSYMSWEKYFIPLLPFWIIYFIHLHGHQEESLVA